MLCSSDFSAFDETATLARFRLTGLSFVHGSAQNEVGAVFSSAIVGYHEAVALQPALVAGKYRARPFRMAQHHPTHELW